MEISEVWDSLSDVSQSAVLEDIAGKRNASVVKSVITNVEDLKGAYADAQNSAGVALDANETYLDSIEGKMGQMTASFETLSNQVLNSGLVKFVVDLLDGFIGLNSAIADTTSALGLIATYVGFAKLIKGFRSLQTSAIAVQTVVSNMATTKKVGGLTEIAAQLSMLDERQRKVALSMSSLTEVEKTHINSMIKQIATGKALSAEQVLSATAVKGLSDADKNQINTIMAKKSVQIAETESLVLYNREQLISAIQTSNMDAAKKSEIISRIQNTAAIESENASLGTQLALMATNPMTWVMVALTAIPLLITGIGELYESTDELHERVEELKNEYNKTAEETKNNINSLTSVNSDGKSLLDEFTELSQGVDAYGNRISLTADEYTRYKEICDTIVGINPDIAKGYDTNTEAIGNNVSALRELIKTQQEKARQDAKDTTSGDNWESRVDDAIAQYKDKIKRTGIDGMSEWARLQTDNQNIANQADINDINKFMHYELGIGSDYDVLDPQDFFEKYFNELKSGWDKNLSKWQEYVRNNTTDPTATHGTFGHERGKWESSELSAYEGYLSDFVDSYESAQKDVEESSKDLIDSYKIAFQGMDGYYELGTGAKKYINNFIDTSNIFRINEETAKKDADDAQDKIQEMVDKIINSDYVAHFADGSTAVGQEIFDKLFNIDTSNISYSDYEMQIKEALNHVYKMIHGENSQPSNGDIIKLGIELGFNFNELDQNSVDGKINEVLNIINQRAKLGTFDIPVDIDINSLLGKLKNLSPDQLNNLFNIDISSYSSWYSFMAALEDTDSKLGLVKASAREYSDALKKFDTNPTKESYSNLMQAAQDYYNVASQSEEELKSTYSNISSELDKLQSAYKSVYTTISDYNSSGVLTIDNLQSLLELDEEYVNLLINENGELNLNSEAFTSLTKTQLENLKIQQAMQIINEVSSLKGQALDAYEASKAYTQAAQSAEEYAMAMIQSKVLDGTMTKRQGDIAMESIAHRYALIDSVSESLDNNTQVTLGAASATDELNSSTNASKNALESQKRALEDQKDALEAEKDALEKTQQALEDKKEGLNSLKDEYKELYDLTDGLLDLAKKYIQQQKNEEKEALEDKKKSLDDIIEKKKKELDIEKDSLEFQKKLNDYNKSIVQNQLKVAASSLDRTSAGKAANRNAVSDLNKSKKDLSDYLKEHNIDSRKDALSSEKERIDKFYENRTKAIDKYLKDEKKLNKDAQDMIGNYSKNTYKKLKKYAVDYTDKTGAEFDNMWTKSKKANQKYNTEGGKTKTLLFILKSKIYGCETKIKNTEKAIKAVKKQIDDKKDGIDALTDKISKIGTKISDINSETKSVKNSIANNVVKPTKTALKNAEKLLNKWKKINDEMSKEHGYKFTFGSTTYKSTASNERAAAKEIQSAIAASHGGGMNLDIDYILKSKKFKAYASGTRSSVGGISITDEKGYEAKLLKTSNGRYTIMPEGSQVFTKEMTDALWSFSNNPMQFLRKELVSSQGTNNSINNNRSVNINMPITITGDATQSTVDALRRQADKIVNTAVNKVYRDVLNVRK